MAEEIVLTMLKEIRADARESREEMRESFGTACHRLSVLEATMASLKGDMAALLSTIPVVNERLDQRVGSPDSRRRHGLHHLSFAVHESTTEGE